MSSNYSSLFPTINNYTITRGPGIGNGHKTQIDIYVPKGTPLATPVSGTVVYAGYHKPSDPSKHSFGNLVIIKADGKYYHFAHLDSIDTKVGSTVAAGNKIGKVGNSGDVKPAPGGDGTHLHFEVRGGMMNGERVNTNDAMDAIINKSNSQPISLNIDSEGYLLDSHGNRLMFADSGQIATDAYYTDDADANSGANNEEALQTMLASEDMKQTASFMSELQMQLPSMMGIMAARLALGEDIKVVSADLYQINYLYS